MSTFKKKEAVMAVTASVQEFLRRANVAYTVFPHVPAYTAQDEAAVTHIPGRDWAKAVVCLPVSSGASGQIGSNIPCMRQIGGALTARCRSEAPAFCAISR